MPAPHAQIYPALGAARGAAKPRELVVALSHTPCRIDLGERIEPQIGGERLLVALQIIDTDRDHRRLTFSVDDDATLPVAHERAGIGDGAGHFERALDAGKNRVDFRLDRRRGDLARQKHRMAKRQNPLAVHVGAVGRTQVDDPVRIIDLADLGVPPGYLGVVEPDRVRVVSTQGQGLGFQLEPLTLVGPLDDEQGGHVVVSPWRGAEAKTSPGA